MLSADPTLLSVRPLNRSGNTAVSKESGEGKDFIYNWRQVLDDRRLQESKEGQEVLKRDQL